MCGICGAVWTDPKNALTVRSLRDMMDRLVEITLRACDMVADGASTDEVHDYVQDESDGDQDFVSSMVVGLAVSMDLACLRDE